MEISPSISPKTVKQSASTSKNIDKKENKIDLSFLFSKGKIDLREKHSLLKLQEL